MADLNEGRLDPRRPRGRFVAFGVVVLVIFTALGGRLFQLQVVRGDELARRAAADRTAEVAIRAPRGLVFDRAGRPVAVNAPTWTVKVRPADLPDAERDRVLGRIARVTDTPVSGVRARLDAFRGSPYDLVPVVRGVSRRCSCSRRRTR